MHIIGSSKNHVVISGEGKWCFSLSLDHHPYKFKVNALCGNRPKHRRTAWDDLHTASAQFKPWTSDSLNIPSCWPAINVIVAYFLLASRTHFVNRKHKLASVSERLLFFIQWSRVTLVVLNQRLSVYPPVFSMWNFSILCGTIFFE